jgi:hypothetical protein
MAKNRKLLIKEFKLHNGNIKSSFVTLKQSKAAIENVIKD